MDRDFFLNAGLNFEPSSQIPPWKLVPPAPEMNCRPENSPVDRFHRFESALSPMVSSPVSNSLSPNNTFAGKLGCISNGAGDVVVNTSCYTTSLNSPPPKLSFPATENMLSPGLPLIPADPGFAERAARFSCFGSRSFNGRTSQFSESQFRSNVSPLAKLPRVSSTPSLKILGSAMAVQGNKNEAETQITIGWGYDKPGANSNEESSVSEQIEIGLKNMNDSNLRKRKKAKEEPKDDSDSKKQKKTEQEGKTQEHNNGGTEKNTKPVEPPKDYIHVRARRGQATDSHSLAERVRREKISERMKMLQDLVPGCNKVTGKALMLDEIINYVQSLQHQVEFLSMKLATVNPKQDFDMNSQLSKDMNQSNQQVYPIESSASDFYQQNPQVLFSGAAPVTHSPVDPLPPLHGFTEAFCQFAVFGGDDLRSIVEMGLRENQIQTSETKIEL